MTGGGSGSLVAYVAAATALIRHIYDRLAAWRKPSPSTSQRAASVYRLNGWQWQSSVACCGMAAGIPVMQPEWRNVSASAAAATKT